MCLIIKLVYENIIKYAFFNSCYNNHKSVQDKHINYMKASGKKLPNSNIRNEKFKEVSFINGVCFNVPLQICLKKKTINNFQ